MPTNDSYIIDHYGVASSGDEEDADEDVDCSDQDDEENAEVVDDDLSNATTVVGDAMVPDRRWDRYWQRSG